MVTNQANNTQETPTTTDETSSRWTVTRVTKLSAIGLIAFVLVFFVFALIISLTASETWAPVMQIMRDTVTIVLMMMAILIISAIAILILQIAHLVNLIQTEIKPILDNARDAAKTTKATAQFVGKNAADPIIQLQSFLAGLGAFIREILKIRRVVSPNKSEQKDAKDG